MRIDESEKIELPIADDGAITSPVVENNQVISVFALAALGSWCPKMSIAKC